MKTKIKKCEENSNEYYLQINPFEDNNVIYQYKIKKRDLYQLYIQLRDEFKNEG